MADHPGEALARVLLDFDLQRLAGLEVGDVGLAGIDLQPQAGRIGDDEEGRRRLLGAKLHARVEVALDHHAGQRAAQQVAAVALAAQPGQAL